MVTCLAKDPADLSLGEIPGEGRWAKEIKKGPVMVLTKGDQTQAPGHQDLVDFAQIPDHGLRRGKKAGEQIPRFNSC